MNEDDKKDDAEKDKSLSPTSEYDMEMSAPDSPVKSVKSTTIVKYSTVQNLANFSQLQCNTNLNLPPSNWLSSYAETYGLQHAPGHTGFSSFRMAHMFPDCVGEVDVISDAENIKKLLKIPYTKGQISMLVHNIEDTLLIDELDIQKYLFRKAESDWEWIRKFFYEHILESLSDKDKAIVHKNKSRYALQQKSLVSKFLYHSLAVSETDSANIKPVEEETVADSTLPAVTTSPPLPEPRIEEEIPDPNSNHKFARNVVWTFEDIQMLIGTDLPIFGDSAHPCISLRLRDMSKPINVLTGIDYWLDNLMCNVPELVMCYHLDGLVQQYELIKTEDLPHLENSKFSPKLIRDIARNILSFLKQNATKAGHTYWLFKGKGDDVVKLYDLTSLCSEYEDKGQNPFTIPVAMLYYRVARNLKSSVHGEEQEKSIQTLLENCIALMPKEKYPQFVTSAHYMLADVYVPVGTDPCNPKLENHLHEKTSVHEEETTESHIRSVDSVEVQSLCVARPLPRPKQVEPQLVVGGISERCNSAMEHIVQGFSCLHYFETSHDSQSHDSKTFGEDEEKPQMARPNEPIPMPYSPLSPQQSRRRASHGSKQRQDENCDGKESPKALLCKKKAEPMPTWHKPCVDDAAFWKNHLKKLLYEKAELVYAILAEYTYKMHQYGVTLRYISIIMKIRCMLEALCASGQNCYSRALLLGRAGDSCFMIVQNWKNVEEHRKDYATLASLDELLMEELQREMTTHNILCKVKQVLPTELESYEQLLLCSCRCYQQALDLSPNQEQKSNLLRRLGNVQNELGSMYMNQVASSAVDFHSGQLEASSVQALLTLSRNYLESGVKSFEAVQDAPNLALLHSNMGRLMRLYAHFHSPPDKDRTELGANEKQYYDKALTHYQKAVHVMGHRRSSPQVWDSVIWEYSTTLFTLGTLLQDFPNFSTKDIDETEREIVDVYHKCLKYCDLDSPGPRQVLYQYRAARVHQQLASLYHSSLRSMELNDARKKNKLQLAKLHYEKAAHLLLIVDHISDFVHVQLAHAALFQEQIKGCSSVSLQRKHLLNALDILKKCYPMLVSLKESKKQESEALKKKKNKEHTSEKVLKQMLEQEEPKLDEEEVKLVKVLVDALQEILHNLNKLYFNRPLSRKESESQELFREWYGRALKLKGNHFQVMLDMLIDLLSSISKT